VVRGRLFSQELNEQVIGVLLCRRGPASLVPVA
jgi:hypothetical protein